MLELIYYCFLFFCGFNTCVCFEENWHAYQSDIRNANREELVVTQVTAVENFTLHGNVKKWTSLSVASKCYSVGLMDSGLAILSTTLDADKSNFVVKYNITHLDRKPTDVIFLQYRPQKAVESEIILVVAFENYSKLHWYKLYESEMELFWEWDLAQPIIHMNAFTVDYKQVLLLVPIHENLVTADLYHYQIHYKRHWLWHSIDIVYPVKSTAFTYFELDSYLSIPQKSLDVVKIYKFEESRFNFYKNIESKKVETVAAFDIAFKSFLAIDGENAGIYQFKRDGLVKEDVPNSNFDDIDYWLPLPVRTYKDDVIVFAQRNINHSSHSNYVTEIFTYNGVKFEEHEDILCTHFGEKMDSLACLNQGKSIVGSSYVGIGDKLGMLVPTPSNISFLYMMHFTIEQIPDPLETIVQHLLKEKERLQHKIETQRKWYEETKSINNKPQTIDSQSEVVLSKRRQSKDLSRLNEQLNDIAKGIEKIKEKVNKLVEKENKMEFNVVTINGAVKIEEGTFKEVDVEKIGGESANELLEDLVRKDSIGKVTGKKTFNKLNVNHIALKKVNGIEAKDIIFNNGSLIKLKGDVTVHGKADIGKVEVLTGHVNDVNLSNQMVDTENEVDGSLYFEKVKTHNNFQANMVNGKVLDLVSGSVNELELDQDLESVKLENLTVTNINGDDFDIFIKQLCLTNVKCYIPGRLKINGDIKSKKTSTTFLNNVRFPEEYLLKNQNVTTPVRGKKIFTKSLVAKEILLNGTIDGVNTKQLITLSTDQINISGKVTFKDIEVAEQLNVTGKILGEHIDKFLPNPTLEVVKDIKSNVNFKKLVVEGDIIIEENFNGKNFKKTLEHVIYKDEEEVEVLVEKQFPKGFTVKNNLEITSNSINNINLDSLVTKDTDQTLNITMVKGDVVIENAIVEGKFNGENITQLDEDWVKLTGTQYIASTLIFTEDVVVENFEVTETLNDANVEEYLNSSIKDPNLEFKMKQVDAEYITVEGNFIGNIADFDIDKIRDSYLSFSKEQTIEKHFDIIHSTVENLEVENINCVKRDEYFSPEKINENVKKLLKSGQFIIKDVYVHGLLNIDSINQNNASYWLPRSHLLKLDGNYKKELIIEGNVFFDTLQINKLSNVTWNWYNQQLIRKNEVSPVINAPYKNFLKGIKVARLIDTEKINGIPIEDILTKEGKQIISGPITVRGDVFFKENVKVVGKWNDVAVGEILSSLKYVNGSYKTKGDIRFTRPARINNLEIRGVVNSKNLTDHMSHIVFLNEDAKFDEEIVFEHPVHISGNLAVEKTVNGIDFSNKLKEIVLVTKDSKIQGPVTFAEPVIVRDQISVQKDLLTNTLYGIDLNEWKNNSVFLDRGKVEGTFGFDDVIIKHTLIIKNLNDMDMNFIVPLKTNQSIDYLEIGEVAIARDVPVLGSVNGYANLSQEYKNTAMIDEDQKINSNIIFDNVILVRENLTAKFINNTDVSKIVFTNTDQNLTGALNFQSKCNIDGDLNVQGLIDGIDMAIWKNRKAKTYSPNVQEVNDKWDVENIIFNSNVRGGGVLNDFNLSSLVEEVEGKINHKYRTEYGIIEDYKSMCKDMTYMYDAVKKQIYKFKYFEELQTITFNTIIQYVYYIHFRDSHYLLVNGNDCKSELLVFTGTLFHYVSVIETGHISQVIQVKGDENIFLVTRDMKLKKKCQVYGTNVWNFDGDNLELYYKIEDQDLLQTSLIPFTFYALSKYQVVEYNIVSFIPKIYRIWNVSEENVAFVPHGLDTGLALRTGQKILLLDRSDPTEDNNSPDTELIVRGSVKEVINHFLPGRNGGDLVITKVGTESARKNLLAVASHEETSVRGRLDFIKIYSDALNGKVFHKVPANKPSSLLSIEFDQGETLLVFLENERTLQVYEYKGIEGFKHRSSARISGSKLFLMTLPVEAYLNLRKTVGIVHENKITVLLSVMLGNHIRDDLKCVL